MEFSIWQMWEHMGVPAICVAVVLLTMGMASLTVFIERVLTLRRSRAASREFAAKAKDLIDRGRVEQAVEVATTFDRGHLARVVRASLTTYKHALDTPDVSGLSPVDRTGRHMERFMEAVGADLRRGLSVLASVGSTAPFIGLLGTVVGIISAFQGIAATGSGGLSGVSAGISEALIETALGLVVAIPAVLAFNYLSTEISREEQVLNHASGELMDRIEGWAELEAKSGQIAHKEVSSPSRRSRTVDAGASLAVAAEPMLARPS